MNALRPRPLRAQPLRAVAPQEVVDPKTGRVFGLVWGGPLDPERARGALAQALRRHGFELREGKARGQEEGA